MGTTRGTKERGKVTAMIRFEWGVNKKDVKKNVCVIRSIETYERP